MINAIRKVKKAAAEYGYLVRIKGRRAVIVYVGRIPFFRGEISHDLILKAAQRAVEKGWKNIHLLSYDSPCSTRFEDGYIILLAAPLAAVSDIYTIYNLSYALAQMGEDGCEFDERHACTSSQDECMPYDLSWDDDEVFDMA